MLARESEITLVNAHILFLDFDKVYFPTFKENKMRHQSTAHIIMEISKEIEKFAAEDYSEMFSWTDEVDLEVLGDYLVERKNELDFERF